MHILTVNGGQFRVFLQSVQERLWFILEGAKFVRRYVAVLLLRCHVLRLCLVFGGDGGRRGDFSMNGVSVDGTDGRVDRVDFWQAQAGSGLI